VNVSCSATCGGGNSAEVCLLNGPANQCSQGTCTQSQVQGYGTCQ
jgi:hypothetical protein